jgi:hypothetical protein
VAKFDISKVLSRAFDTIGSNLGTFLTLSLVLGGIPAFLLNWWQAQFVTTGDPRELLAIYASREFLMPALAVMAISVVTHAVLQAALARATVRSLTGHTQGFGETLEAGLGLCLPVLAISLLFSIGTALGLILLIVPGVILWLCWCVAIPAYVEERPGIFAAFGRSLELTAGERGNIFLLFLVVTIGMAVFGGVVGFVGGIVGGTLAPSLVQAFIASVSSMVSLTTIGTTYVALVEAKEGAVGSELESIVDEGATGSVNTNAAPRFVGSSAIVPPVAASKERAIGRPSPVPPPSRLPVKKGWNTRDMSPLLIPLPSSATRIEIIPSPSSSRIETRPAPACRLLSTSVTSTVSSASAEIRAGERRGTALTSTAILASPRSAATARATAAASARASSPALIMSARAISSSRWTSRDSRSASAAALPRKRARSAGSISVPCSSSNSIAPRMPASGVLNSWLTAAAKSRR